MRKNLTNPSSGSLLGHLSKTVSPFPTCWKSGLCVAASVQMAHYVAQLVGFVMADVAHFIPDV